MESFSLYSSNNDDKAGAGGGEGMASFGFGAAHGTMFTSTYRRPQGGTTASSLTSLPLSTIRRPTRRAALRTRGAAPGSAAGAANQSTLSVSMMSDASFTATSRPGVPHSALRQPRGGGGGGGDRSRVGQGGGTNLSAQFNLHPRSFYGGVTDLSRGGDDAGARRHMANEDASPDVADVETSLSQIHEGIKTVLDRGAGAGGAGNADAARREPTHRSAARIAELEARVAALTKQRPQPDSGAAGSGSRKRPRVSVGSTGSDDRLALRRQSSSSSVADSAGDAHRLAGEVASLKAQVEEAELMRQRDAEEHKLELQSVQSEVGKLRRQLQFMTSEEEETRGRLKAAEKAALDARHEYATNTRKLQAMVSSLRESLADRDDQLEAMRRELEASAGNHGSNEADRVGEHAMQQRLQELSQQYGDAAKQAALVPQLEARVQAAEAALRAQPDAGSQRETVDGLRRRLDAALSAKQAAEAELKRIQATSESVELLQERARVATAKAQRMEQQALAGQRARVEADALRMEARRWDDLFRDVLKDLGKLPGGEDGAPGGSEQPAAATVRISPDLVLDILRDLRMERAVMLRAQGTTEANAASARREVASSARRIADLERELSESQERMLEAESKQMVADRKAAWLTRERDSLKRLCETFEAGEASSTNAGADDTKAAQAAKAAAERAAQRIAHLEEELRAAKSSASDAIREVSAATPKLVHAKAKSRIKSLESQVTELQSRNTELANALAKAEQDAAYMEAQVARGDFRRSTTKVVHLAMNPAKKAAQAKAAERTKMVTELSARVVQLEEQLAARGAAPAASATAAVAATPAALASVDLNKKMQRLKEAFRDKTTAFREAVYLLTGYKIEMSGGGRKGVGAQLRLRSMYGEQEDDCLLFKLKEGGGLELLESDFTQRMEAKLFTYLTSCHSIPAFLSNLTLELFERQTFVPMAESP